MTCDDCDKKIYSKGDPVITIVRNLANDKFSVTLQNWNTPANADGYSVEEVDELRKMLEQGVVQLHNCWEENNHDSLFTEEDNANEEYTTTE